MKKTLAAIFVVSAFHTSAFAANPCDGLEFCVSPTGVSAGSGVVKSTKWYTGLIWEIGNSKKGISPDFVFGVRNTETKSNNKVNGADLNIRFSFDKGLIFDSASLLSVYGRPSTLAQLGVGYSFKERTPIFAGGISTGHLRVTSEYVISQSNFKYFAEINTLNKPPKTNQGGLSC
jgi:hypothetical protein